MYRKAGNRALKLVRRSACLVFFFEKGDLRCTNYLTGITVASTPRVVLLLKYLDVWRNYEEIEQLFSGYSATSLRSILRQLLEHTLLIEKDSDQAKREADLETWSIWEPRRAFFTLRPSMHFSLARPYRMRTSFPVRCCASVRSRR